MARILGFVVGGDTVNCIVFWNHTVVYVLCTKKGDTIFLAISCKKTQDLIKLLKRTHSYICTNVHYVFLCVILYPKLSCSSNWWDRPSRAELYFEWWGCDWPLPNPDWAKWRRRDHGAASLWRCDTLLSHGFGRLPIFPISKQGPAVQRSWQPHTDGGVHRSNSLLEWNMVACDSNGKHSMHVMCWLNFMHRFPLCVLSRIAPIPCLGGLCEPSPDRIHDKRVGVWRWCCQHVGYDVLLMRPWILFRDGQGQVGDRD